MEGTIRPDGQIRIQGDVCICLPVLLKQSLIQLCKDRLRVDKSRQIRTLQELEFIAIPARLINHIAIKRTVFVGLVDIQAT